MAGLWLILIIAMFAAIPAAILLFVVRATTTENQLRAIRDEKADMYAAGRAAGSYPHILARTPTIFLVVVATISAYVSWEGLVAIWEGNIDTRSINAAGWGILICSSSIVGLHLKYREIAAARRYEKVRGASAGSPNAP